MRASVVTRTRPVRHRTLRPMAGQLFEATIARDVTGWTVSIPELDAEVHVVRRAEAESAARECIAVRTGIPISFVAVWIRD
ncbi:long chain fatty acid-CoA synthetase [Mycolicibacterium arenosum]|uniref:Long chain fatty acid-CoA synthetase n=1 Tax=Mycolicibacterium arenosum TaxID=2952157 RepID=A0ABT1LYP9_9MYCO|nr:long chain fatty acid-CoA synthetase [Mycolicibacterium sp. CAU 1645]MCP9272035.1 long chain fatty acid-CoA synthetase [Mycolicibacterium sp. CAU 1645]